MRLDWIPVRIGLHFPFLASKWHLIASKYPKFAVPWKWRFPAKPFFSKQSLAFFLKLSQNTTDLLYIQNASTRLKCCAKWYARRILYRCKFASCVSKPLLTWLEFCAALQKAIVVSEPCLVSRLIWCRCSRAGKTLSHLPWENLNLMLKRPSFVNQNDNQSLFRKKSFPIFSTPPCF